MIAVVDYGMGNLRSVEKAFAFLGHRVKVTGDPREVAAAEGVVLPGVGAFGDAVRELEERGLTGALMEVLEEDRPFLGICLGYQLLCGESEESPGARGLGFLPGRVVRFGEGLKVPHMGWNDVHVLRPHPLLEGIEDGTFFYFVHSYYVLPDREEDILMRTEYGVSFASGAAVGKVAAFQFHPEKSSTAGLRILDNFARFCREGWPESGYPREW
ncbi:imidazole glycerol phosphate synthase subunit HisH [Candidatus Solincola tengchongensis]|uniref:imidazole glycerol phosphate synthase subunit HisH n=1 Tax=Candidatus Solincola tengchongensis TaxID=2900693 RepID=UPI00257CA120|nr:imidazole glycerol phosphate synthase subunit HisH [Candidatus Solincola tengchongensis]